jgi:periplasmic mercuric ion binding protein
MKIFVTSVMAAVLTIVFPTLPRASAVEVPPPQGEDPSPVMVNVSEVHLCCGACVKALAKAAKIDGVQADVHQDEGTVILTAATYDDIQKALDEIAKAGFCGKIEDDTQNGKIQFPEIKTADGNVKKLTVRHIHNCCRGCSDAIIEAIESVDGVTSNTVKPKKVDFVVEGDFDPGEVVEAIQNAGLYPEIE